MSINRSITAFTLKSHAGRFGMLCASAAFAVVVGACFARYFNYDLNYSPGWHEDESGKYYIIRTSHERAVGLNLISNASYLFDDDGYMLTGWQTFEGYTYYFDDSGVMQKGIVTIDGEEYYFSDESGIFKTGLHDFNGEEYYFNDHGFPDSGFNSDGDYYYDEHGKRISGFAEINGIQYYFFEDGENEGKMAKGWTEINGKTYYFANDGHMVTGISVIDGYQYNFQKEGSLFKGWTKTEDDKNYMYADETTGRFAQGFTEIEGKTYYFDENFLMVTGWKKIDGARYHFDDQGVMTVGWFEDNGNKYYFFEDGKGATGIIKLDYEYYNFDTKTNKLIYGWTEAGTDLYYSDEEGKVQQGFLDWYGDVYFFDQTTHKAASKGLTKTLPFTAEQVTEIKQFVSDYKLMQKYQVWETVKDVADPDKETKEKQEKYALTAAEEVRMKVLEKSYLEPGTYDAFFIEAYNKLGNSVFYQHYFGPDHLIGTGWKSVQGYKFYFSPTTGEKVTGWQTIDGKRYYFGDFGVCAIGKLDVKTAGSTLDYISYEQFDFGTTGSLPSGLTKTDDGLRYASGDSWVKGSFVTEGNDTYYFDANGYALKDGMFEIDGKLCYFDSSGKQKLGLVKHSDSVYYLDKDGAYKEKWVNTESGDTYYMTSAGFAATGWTEIDGVVYYFDSDGKLKKGWTEIDGKKYYLHDGVMLRGEFYSDGKVYVIGDSGYVKEGWATWNSYRYYTDDQGVAKTNTTETIDGVTYYFDEHGIAREQ